MCAQMRSVMLVGFHSGKINLKYKCFVRLFPLLSDLWSFLDHPFNKGNLERLFDPFKLTGQTKLAWYCTEAVDLK